MKVTIFLLSLLLIVPASFSGQQPLPALKGVPQFAADPKTSVLDPYCRAHDVENLFVVDASFFPSSAAVNPALTIIAQALRVAEHLMETDLK